MTTHCEHTRTQVISHDGNGEYVECLDCKEIFESGDLDESRPKEDFPGSDD